MKYHVYLHGSPSVVVHGLGMFHDGVLMRLLFCGCVFRDDVLMGLFCGCEFHDRVLMRLLFCGRGFRDDVLMRLLFCGRVFHVGDPHVCERLKHYHQRK